MTFTVPQVEWQSRRIKAARALRHKSAQQVADALEVSLTQYKRGESMARRWSPGEVLAIARFLNVPDEWLLHEKFDPFNHVGALERIEQKINDLTHETQQDSTQEEEDRPATSSSRHKQPGNADRLLDSAGRKSQKRVQKK